MQEMADWMKHSRESVIGAGPGPFPESVNVPVTTGKGVAYMHFLPAFKQTAVWKDAPTPKKAILLRTGAEVPFNTRNGNLHIDLAADLRSTNVDVVKLEF
jgi:alpha-L-fucosidase